METSESRIARLERTVQRMKTIAVLGIVAGCTIAVASARTGANPASPEVLRVRGLVIEDAQGRARILLGAPIPTVPERQRTDTTTGLLIIDPSGLDRVSVGSPAIGPAIKGRVVPRTSPASGLVFNDATGQERGGLGVLDNGAAVLGLDRLTGEGVMLVVKGDGSLAGMIINEENNRNRVFLGSDHTTSETGLVLKDDSGQPRVGLQIDKNAPRLNLFDKGQVVRDVLDQARQR